jgi:GntR family transcriptional regulator, hexuronate regulon transcriptional repressor
MSITDPHIPVRPIRNKRLYEQIAEKISLDIQSGVYSVGSRLPPERDLAEMFDVGRPTVREALIALEVTGMVDVRTGSGIYVLHARPLTNATLEMDIGPFELTEARCLFESDAAALAATLITDQELEGLRAAIVQMEYEDLHNIHGEKADRDFHLRIAQATRNSAVLYVIESLWNVRDSSPLCKKILDRVRNAGVKPRIDEHQLIYDALAKRDPKAAKTAMRNHLARVIDDLLSATEVEELEAARLRVNQTRQRFTLAQSM